MHENKKGSYYPVIQNIGDDSSKMYHVICVGRWLGPLRRLVQRPSLRRIKINAHILAHVYLCAFVCGTLSPCTCPKYFA